LSAAWEWSASDHILQVLPLNHIHGLQNILNCALYNGAVCEMHEKFDARAIWHALLREEQQPTLFFAVPSIYHSLIKFHEKKFDKKSAETRQSLQKMRLFVSGSSALPERDMESWRRVSGHTLLERYGMTELGMALSNPYRGDRKP